jgi:hypothetical protein
MTTKRTRVNRSTSNPEGPPTCEDTAGEWCAVCHLQLDGRRSFAPGELNKIRHFLKGRGPVTRLIHSTLILMFDVSGTASGAKSKSVGLVWDALEFAGIDELELTSLKLVPTSELTRANSRQQTPASYVSGSMVASEMSSLRREILKSSTPLETYQVALELDKSVARCFNNASSGEDCTYEEVCEAVSLHPGLQKHRDFLSWAVGLALSEERDTKSPQEIAERIVNLTLDHIFTEVISDKCSVIGATEAAPILGVSIERMRQIAHEERKFPIPIAWIGGKRPVWLRDDVETESYSRITSAIANSHAGVDSGALPNRKETGDALPWQFDARAHHSEKL